jgi:hypothetical protein
MSKALRAVSLLVLLVVLFVPTLIALKWVAITEIYSYFVRSIANVTGINLYLVKAGVLVALVPFFYGLKLFFSFSKTKRRTGAAILTTLAIGYNIGLYFATRQAFFTAKGETIRYFALTPEGVKYSDRPGVEPVYGVPFKPVTPDLARNLKLLEKGDFRTVDPARAVWFNPITGQAQLWYYQYPDGALEFYDKPGYHPFTNDPLKEVTKQVYLEWREKAKATQTTVAQVPRVEGPGLFPAQAGPPRPVLSDRERRVEEFKGLVNRSLAVSPLKRTVAVVIDCPARPGGLSVADAFYGLLRANRAAFVNNLFRLDVLKAKGFFDEIYQGDKQLLNTAASLSGVDYVIMAKLDYSFRKAAQVDPDLISCDLRLNCRVANRNGDIVVSDSLSAVGPGFTEEAAIENAVKVLSGRFAESVLKRIM